MSSVGSSCISPDGDWAHLKTDNSKRSVSVLSLRSVRSTLVVRFENAIWVGSTVNVAAFALNAHGPPPRIDAATSAAT